MKNETELKSIGRFVSKSTFILKACLLKCLNFIVGPKTLQVI